MDSRKSILVVEDDPDSQYLMQIILEDMHFNFTIAATGKDAIDNIQKKQFDLVLMDLRLPDISGYDVTRIIRQELKKNIPIFAVTAHAAQSVSLKCYDLGMNEFIPKPVDIEKLKLIINTYLG
ncbi:MAG: response regulator [Candidatus Omnitrophota bacterium]